MYKIGIVLTGNRDVLSPEQYARLAQQTQPDAATQALLNQLSSPTVSHADLYLPKLYPMCQ